MLKIAIKIALLLSVLIFIALIGTGIIWQVALMRSLIAYLILLIVFYVSVLLITITRGRVISKESEEFKETQKQ